MYRLRLQATDSRYATVEERQAAQINPDELPSHKTVMAHQAATLHALRFGDAPIIINTAMTGDGKTLASRLRLLLDKVSTFVMYPTNELALDQKQSFEREVNEWPLTKWEGRSPDVQVINARTLDEEQAKLEEMARSAMLRLFLDSEYALTNPDIFHHIMSFQYARHGEARDTLLAELAHRFSLFVFDEFHLFGVAQTASVMMAIVYLLQTANPQKPPRFLFLSATPQKMLEKMANRAGIKTEVIGGLDYEHGLDHAPPGYRRILQPVDLSLYTGTLELWVQEHIEDVILAFFGQHQPAAMGVIIANSVATAHRVYHFLVGYGTGLRIGLNTGLTPQSERGRDDGTFDLIVATSTVDVGVDFRINQIIFESPDAATHTQRLGRLGRHTTGAKGHEFKTFEAHAIVPAWVEEGIAQQFPDGTASRHSYNNAVNDLLTPFQQFEPYVNRWAGVQAGNILYQMRKFDVKSQYNTITQPLRQTFGQLFGKSLNKHTALLKNEQHITLEASASFRGGSPFTVLLRGMAESSEIVSYNLLPLLYNAELEAVPMREMLRSAGQYAKALERSEPLAAYRLRGWTSAPRRLEITFDQALEENEWEAVIEKRGFRLSPMGVSELNALNDVLETRAFAVLCVRDKAPELVRRKLRLGYFDLLPFRDAAGVTGSIAFGRDALLLDSVLYRVKRDNSLMIW